MYGLKDEWSANILISVWFAQQIKTLCFHWAIEYRRIEIGEIWMNTLCTLHSAQVHIAHAHVTHS